MRPLQPFAVFAVAAATVAQQPQETQERVVALSVTGANDRSIYLDHGRDVGLKVGSIVQLFPPGAGSIDVEVRSVSNTSARAELPPGIDPPPVGTRGEARVAVVAEAPSGGAGSGRAVPAHPPWQRQEGQRGGDQPLLVPTFRQSPDARPATLDGRAFLLSQWTRDDGGDRASDYMLSRLGVRADATNWFGAAERVRFAGEIEDRRVTLADAPDDDDQYVRLDLLSVALGTEQWAPTGFEAGRFFSQHLPEIGLFDGIEVVRRYQGGVRFGAGVGSYPLPYPVRDTGSDLGVHAFLDFTLDARRTFAAAIGAQKTWHEGSPDRDLLLFRLEGRPSDRVTLFGSAKVDFYTGSDVVKGSGAELTEAFGSARWDDRTLGAGITATHFTWAELKREEYQSLPTELVADGKVDRVSLSGWGRPADWLRLAARADLWQDQDRDGTAFHADGDVRDVLGLGSSLSLSIFQTDGGYSSGPGARIGLRAPLAGGSWRIGYRWHRYDVEGLVTGPETYTRQSAECGIALPVWDRGDLDCSIEHWFGDREDAWTFGLYLQWRF